jgi:hypothetical protein
MTEPSSSEVISSDTNEQHEYWVRFTKWSGVATAATVAAFIPLVIIDDTCSNAFAFVITAWMIVPLVTAVGLVGLAVRSEKWRRAWPLFGAVALILVWMLWLFVIAMATALGEPCY